MRLAFAVVLAAWTGLLFAVATACDAGSNDTSATGGTGGNTLECQCSQYSGCTISQGGDGPICPCPPYTGRLAPTIAGSAPTPFAPTVMGSIAPDYAYALAALPDGGVVVVGRAGGSVETAGGPAAKPDPTLLSLDLFLAWVSATGEVTRVRNAFLSDSTPCAALADGAGALYLLAMTPEQVQDGISIPAATNLLRIDASGTLKWVRSVTGYTPCGKLSAASSSDVWVGTGQTNGVELTRYDSAGNDVAHHTAAYTDVLAMAAGDSGSTVALLAKSPVSFTSAYDAFGLVDIDASGSVTERVAMSGQLPWPGIAVAPGGRAVIYGKLYDGVSVGAESLSGAGSFWASVDAAGNVTRLQAEKEEVGSALVAADGRVLLWLTGVDRLALRGYDAQGTSWSASYENPTMQWVTRLADARAMVLSGKDAVVAGTFEGLLDVGAAKLEAHGCLDVFTMRVPFE